ncbi:MAG: hypothetical protein EXQ79_09590 [Acidimicrobiia bacterium]|nr:hypothetical protein [Acidimicrobiia bacterium]
MDSTGDSSVTWAIDDPVSVAEAEAVFSRLARERKIPFARMPGAPASDAERISTFDPALEEIVWVRPIAGG